MKRVYLILMGLCLFAASCGYRFQADEANSEKRAISVAYVAGDTEGSFTDVLIHAIASSSHFDYCREGGDLLLSTAIVAATTEKTGYRYDRKGKEGELQKNIVPTEEREGVTVQVTVCNACTGEVILGPCTVKASADYDFVDYNSINDLSFVNEQGVRQSSIAFSLGQLDSIEGAKQDIRAVLYRRLAEKIVDGLERQHLIKLR